MESDERDVKAKIFYCFREKYYNTMLMTCKEGMSKFKGNLTFHLYHSLALMLNNRIEEGINDLETLRSENDMKLSVAISLMYANKILGVTNKSLFVRLDGEIREFRRSAEGIDYYYSAFVLCVFNKMEKAYDYAEKALAIDSGLLDCSSLKGWILLQLHKNEPKSLKNATTIFKTIVQDNKHLDATLGLVECCIFQNNFDQALAVVNKSIVKFPSLYLPLIFKMKLMYSMQFWDQTMEIMNRILNTNSENLDAIKINILILLCREAKYEEALLCIKRFVQELEKQEPENCMLLIKYAQLFSKICGRNQPILQETYRMVERAIQSNTNNAEYIVELGYQKLLQGKTDEAVKYFKTATKLDESSIGALIGITQCELLENRNSEQLQKQVNFLLELEHVQNSPLLLLIRAKICKVPDEAINLLNQAAEVQFEKVKPYPLGETYLELLDPDFLLEVAKEYMQYISSGLNLTKAPLSKPGKNTEVLLRTLQTVTKACPGLQEATFLLAKLQYLTGDTTGAISNLNYLLPKDEETSSDAHLLMAQIHLQNGLYDRAAQSLEASLSNNFKVRQNPIYHYVDGVVNKHTNNLSDAIKSFTTALNMVNIRQENNKKENKRETELKVSLSEKAKLYVELIDVHNAVGQTEEAAKLLENATVELKGTPEESRILILSADQYLQRKNIQAAIDILSKVHPEESYYLKAKSKLADIFLNYQKDRYAYLQCYQEMAEKDPGTDSYVLLGDAYMKILEPDEALECYNRALEQNPKDPFLTSKMGKALIETHYFSKAITYYKETIKLTGDPELKLQLADLYYQLKEYPKAEVLLITEIESETDKDLDDLSYLQYKTKLYNLLALIQEKSSNIQGAIATLKNAKDNQTRVRKRLVLDNSVADEETNLLISICIKLAELAVAFKDQDQATQHYKDALDISPNDIQVQCALAKLYMQMGYLELCQKTCTDILRLDPDNDAASVMMADIAFHKVDFDMAQFHFTQLVTKQPTNWNALIRLVEIMRRTGNLNDVPEYLKSAEQNLPNPSKEAGFLYSTALYQWYSGNLNGALRNFNLSRQDPEWSQMSIYNMIEICLNPNDELFVEQVLDNEDSEYRDSRTMALKTADRLLKELKQKLEANGDEILKYKLLSNFRLIATKEKFNIERALEDFIILASQNMYKDNIGITLGIATVYTLLKQQQRAKNQLKRIVKTQWTFEDAEYLERCWLLLADHYIQSPKFESAVELLNKVVHYNKSCGKAYEYLGFISEKEQRYKDSCNYYEQAWKLGGKSNPTIGFKLAYSYMKNKKYPNAIDVGYEVLKINPDYPRVKKDILDKSLNNLRI